MPVWVNPNGCEDAAAAWIRLIRLPIAPAPPSQQAKFAEPFRCREQAIDFSRADLRCDFLHRSKSRPRKHGGCPPPDKQHAPDLKPGSEKLINGEVKIWRCMLERVWPNQHNDLNSSGNAGNAK